MTLFSDRTQKLALLYEIDTHGMVKQAQRWEKLISEFHKRFGEADIRLFSTPGRTEIGGNHTDHNHGKVLAASINLDSIAVAAQSAENAITMYSEQYPQPFIVKLDNLSAVDSERGTTAALMRGIASRFQQLGYHVGGFHACVTSDVLIGSGLSSSASVEVLIATILNSLYNQNTIEPITIAQLCQYAENNYFGKPCGLMDQITCAVGGIVKIDFNDPQSPLVERMEFDFSREGYSVLVVDTGGNHADLTEEYASIPREMKSVAAYFGKEFCREVSEQELLNNATLIRSSVGERAFSRALHFIEENKRVDLQVQALQGKDFSAFLRLVNESGNSSYRRLQNVVAESAPTEQGIATALAISELFINKIGVGACRVHGGGFAGTIQAFLPHEKVIEYTKLMESIFVQGCVNQITIRPVGTVELQ